MIEISIVVLILALMATLATPSLQRFLGGDSRSVARELSGVVSELVQDAIATHTIHRLYYDLDERTWWVTTLAQVGGVLEESEPVGSKRSLPSDVRFEDVVTSHQGLTTSGTAFTQFFPNGGVTRTTIHLADDDQEQFTLMINPITARIEVVDGYVERVGRS